MGLVLLLSACGGNSVNRVPDTAPQASVATINGLEARKPENGIILAPATQMFDPNSNTTVANRVPVGVTSSDERQVVEVTLILRQGERNSVGDIVYSEVWRDTLSADANEEIFRNPFTFVVPFQGARTGLVPAELEIIATDDKGQDNELYQAAVQVDGSLPLLNASVPSGPQKGIIAITGQADDPESGLTEVAVLLDGDEVGTKFVGSSFTATIDTTGLAEGTHSLLIYAVNGVNEVSADAFTLQVKNEAEEAPTP